MPVRCGPRALWNRMVSAICTSLGGRLLPVLVAVQAVFGARVAWRLLRSAGGRAIERGGSDPTPSRMRGCISVIVPVLNETDRLSECLDGLIAQGTEVAEILVVDGGSDDGTQELVRGYAALDARVLLVDASPVPADWNGKAWGLQVGLDRSDRRTPLAADDRRRRAPCIRPVRGVAGPVRTKRRCLLSAWPRARRSTDSARG